MTLHVGIVGAGAFARHFIPLFQAHPLVGQVTLCDLDADKLAQRAAEFGITSTSPSLDHLCGTPVDAVVVMTQNWLHAPQAVQALQAGKHVYSAVPAGIQVDEIRTLVQTVAATGKVYMLGETSYYYPAVLYCRQRFRQGDFGRVVYAEAEYYHDWDHGLYEVMRWRGGAHWQRFAGGPPMHYPTHSVSQVVSVTGAHMVRVSCQGVVDASDDGIYPDNQWRNPYSNQSALFHMSDGSVARINEFRRIGHPGAVRMSMWGTTASFEENAAGAVWVTKDRQATQRLDELLACGGMPARHSTDTSTDRMARVTAADGTHLGVAAVHPVERLPRAFVGLPNGHCGSHQFLVDDFLQACASGHLPPNDVWAAARYTIPGLVAHDSAMRGGELLEVPDLGDPPLRHALQRE